MSQWFFDNPYRNRMTVDRSGAKGPHETIKKDRSATTTAGITIHIDEETKIEVHLVRRVIRTYQVTVPRNRRRYHLPIRKGTYVGTEREYRVVINHLKLDPGRRSRDGYPEFRNVCTPFKHTLTYATELDWELGNWTSKNRISLYESDIRKAIQKLWITRGGN